ncbi:MAG: glycosyltransferase family 2 protein [Chitinophagaceae bacterium]|nr:glycosyltransferase family 2 protein [Chitinophagaceae bacterium]
MKPLSFIIITYNRPDDALELLQNIAGLNEAVSLLEEIILVNNRSTVSYEKVQAYVRSQPSMPFKYIDAPENLGVARGRNFALKFATAPILILLDDDAVLQNKDALQQTLQAFEHTPADQPGIKRETAIVSFKVLYYDSLSMQQNALPHKKYGKYKDKQSFYTYYYAGGAHAIKKNILEQIGYYPEDFFYGMEEYDMAYRILDKGYAIQYNDSIVMLHKESPLGRKPTSEKLKMMWVNKSKVAWRYLPKKYFYTTALFWSFQYLKVTGFNLKHYFRGWKAIAAIPGSERRKKISAATLAYLKETEARLHY